MPEGGSAEIVAYSYMADELTIPETLDGIKVTSIGDQAFFFCISLASVTIPDIVTSIGALAFADCYSLTSVTIPDSVTSIDYMVFSKCPELTLAVEAGSCAEQYAQDNEIPYDYINALD